MNSTLTPPGSQTEPSHETPGSTSHQPSPPLELQQRRRREVVGLLLLILGIAHLALIPGLVIAGQSFGWHDKLWPLGGLDPLITWPIVSLLVALSFLYYLRAALRPLGLPIGPRAWMRPMVKGAVTSLLASVLLWPGLEPSPLVFALIPLADAAVLVAWGARRFYRRGPLAQIQAWVGPPPQRRAWFERAFTRVGLSIATILGVLVVMIGSWFLVPVSTPSIVDARGHRIPESIATMQQVRLGGVDQWIVMRGTSVRNPVLLWLAGGPGGSELGWVRHYNAELEKHFVVVNWEQRGAGKDFLQYFTDSSHMTPQQYIQDGLQLTNYLRHRFHQDKIYLVGHSWGTFLGMWLIQQRPQWFHAYVGVSQMVDGARNDRLWYEITLQRARQVGDTGAVKTLEGYGPPSLAWYRENLITVNQKIAGINFINDKYMAQDMEAHGGTGDNGDLSIAVNTTEYRPIDKLFWPLGVAFVFPKVYAKLYPVNFVKQASHLKVPVYFVEGRWDINAPTILVKQLYRAMHAPSKHLVWFERSGHNPCYQEPGKFNAFMINTVLRRSTG